MSIPLLLYVFLFFLLHPSPSSADYTYHICDDSGNYTANSTYATNLNFLLSSIPTNTSSNSGFSKSSTGSIPNKVSALALCRGDINSSSCLSCIDVATHDAPQLCPYYKSVTIYYDRCLLSYSNQSFLNSTENSHQSPAYNIFNVSNPTLFNELVGYLLNKTADSAAYNSSDKVRYSTAQVGFDEEFHTIYGLEQCTPDLTKDECKRCLDDLVGQAPQLFGASEGARILGLRCILRYEVYSFYEGAPKLMLEPPTAETAPSPAPTVHQPETPASPEEGKKKNTTGIVLAIAISVAAALSLGFLIFICFWRKRRSSVKIALPHETHGEDIESVESLLFDLSTLRVATANFAEVNKLGEGGFGAVYKGLLPDGQDIAVKRLSKSSAQGLGELKNELKLVCKLQHKNLVRLLGVCVEEQEKLLVYEFVPNRSLDTILFDDERRQRRGQLDWGKRYKIINGISRGLLYLHEDSQLKIIHRDLKASNILLDAEMIPKIADFGLAKLFGGDQTQGITGRVVGTFGYMAPEYVMRGHMSIKSDVYSFGVLVLEIVTGKRNNGYFDSDQDLLSYIWEHWNTGRTTEIIDPSLGNHYFSEMLRSIHIGLLCVQEDPVDRPNMSMVVLMLSSETVSLKAPLRPAFCISRSNNISDFYTSSSDSHGDTRNMKVQNSNKSKQMSQNEVSITELEPR